MEGFTGTVVTRWDDNNHRDMTLVHDFSYTDPAGKEWRVPAGSFLNGATIPAALWSLVGSPYTGSYRRASIIHDYYVGEGVNPDVPAAERRQADKMFYHACRFDGCSASQAAILYLGVRTGTWLATRNPFTARIAENILGFETYRMEAEAEATFNELLLNINLDLEHATIDMLEAKADLLLEQMTQAQINNAAN